MERGKARMDLQQWFREPQSRRHMLRHLGLFAGATLALDAGIVTVSRTTASIPRTDANPIKHILIACQENRTFDEYYGYYPRAGEFDKPCSENRVMMLGGATSIFTRYGYPLSGKTFARMPRMSTASRFS